MADDIGYGEMCYTSQGIQHYLQPLDCNVLTAAKQRINHLLDTFDTLAVAFSGGKDSLVVLRLVREVYEERGIREKVKVFFRDEEVIPYSVIDFVTEVYNSGEYDFSYFAIPLKSTKFILGNSTGYIQFDPNREWVRQPPPFAIRLPAGDKRVFDQRTADDYICKAAGYRGRVAIVCGIRAQESIVRFRACINKKNDSYINATDSKRVMLAKPIYDWSENDVFLYMMRRNISYCPIYDEQLFNSETMRVSTPLHAESAKRLFKLKTRCGDFYNRLIEVFPDAKVQADYYQQFNATGDDSADKFAKYEKSLSGLLQYIADTLEGDQAALARKRIIAAYSTRVKVLKQGNSKTFGGYPMHYLFTAIKNAAYKREIMPRSSLTDTEIQFEKGAK